MARLSWGATGERFFETGTDRGVLYLTDQPGVPWNGLKAVSEAPDGGSPMPYYIDGYKYLNVASAEEFRATLEAFSAPREFGVCDGTVGIHNGLFATQQPRKSFGLSYRTLVGNDIQGVDHGYKIHLVYNALAAPSTRANKSVAGSIDPLALSWGISTMPPKLLGLKPTAHFIIDSRLTPRGLMDVIEDILYGSIDAEARLPEISEIMDLFSGPAPIQARNLTKFPSFEQAGSSVDPYTNVALNPNGAGTLGFAANNSAVHTMVKNVAVPAPHPNGVLTCVSSVVKSGQVTPTLMSSYNLDGLANTGPARYFAAWFYVNAEGYAARLSSGMAMVPIPANEWVLLIDPNQLAANTYSGAVVSKISGNASESDVAYITEVTGSTLAPPKFTFSGGTPISDFTAIWAGAANGSETILRGVRADGFSGGFNQIIHYQTTDEPYSGQYAGRALIVGSSAIGIQLASDLTLTPGEIYTMMTRIRPRDHDLVATPRILAANGPATLFPKNIWSPVVLTIAAGSGASAQTGMVLSTGAALPGDWIDFDEVTFVEGVYNGPPFDGNTPDTGLIEFEWEGPVNNSTSVVRSWNPI